jgi:aryl-alcohol dehydrogenase-like predicted oxidoreductase
VEYRLLGRTGLRVSTLCLGTVLFGTYVPNDESKRIVHAALDRGVNFVDTAEIYQRPNYGAAEELLGRALQGRRHDVILATKKRYDPGQFRTGRPTDVGLSRREIVAGIEGSLRRLQTDYVDLYYPHHVDPEVDLEESLRAFDDLVRAGKVRAIGLSNYPASLVVESLWIADRRNLNPVCCVQTLYNLLAREAGGDLAAASQRHGLSLVAYSPLAGGVLTGKYAEGVPPDSRAATFQHREAGRPGHVPVLSQANLAAAARVAEVAAEVGATATQLSVAWVLHQRAVASAIVGASRVEQLDELVGAADLRLDADVLAATGRVSGVAVD